MSLVVRYCSYHVPVRITYKYNSSQILGIQMQIKFKLCLLLEFNRYKHVRVRRPVNLDIYLLACYRHSQLSKSPR